jgi:hypothetical protein
VILEPRRLQGIVFKKMKKCLACSKEQKVKGYCARHYWQIKNCGKILERTIRDKNEIIVNGDICTMNLYDRKNNIVANTSFNKKHLNRVKKLKWGLQGMGYVANYINNVYLHVFIKGNKDGLEIDHIDRDPLNNLDDNLRYATHGENCRNRAAKGICWDKRRNKWLALIKLNYKSIYLGRYENKNEAIKARREAERKYYGEFAPCG